MLNLNHKKLKAWQLAILLYKEILLLVRKLPKEEQFNLISQIRRAALSDLAVAEDLVEQIFKLLSKMIDNTQ